VDAWHATCCRRINREETGISIGAAQALAYQRPRQVDIRGVHGCSSDFLWSFGAPDRLADSGIWHDHEVPSCRYSYVEFLALFERARKHKTLYDMYKSV
jgi:hypothetical protein